MLKALIAAINPFAGGNSRLARSLRARKQPRDRKGRFIRTGSGVKFDIRIGGKVVPLTARSVGSASREGYIQMYVPAGDPNLPAGFYEVESGKGMLVQAVIDAPEVGDSSVSVTDKNIIDLESIRTSDSPEGWDFEPGENGEDRWVSQDGKLEILDNSETGKIELSENGKKISEHAEVPDAFVASDKRDIEQSLTKNSKTVVARLRANLDDAETAKDAGPTDAKNAREALDNALFDDPDSEEKLALVDSEAPDPESMGESVQLSPKDLADMRRSPLTSQHLNEDGTFTEERQALHDEIIRRALEGSTPVENPTQWMNGGGPGSGKSSLTEGVNKELTGYDENSVLLDPDEVKRELPEVQEALARIEAGEATEDDIEWAGLSHEESSYIAKRIHLAALERHHNVIFDGTGDGSVDSVRKKVELARKNGYKRIEANYLYLEPDEGIKRAKERQAKSHRKVPTKVIEETYQTVSSIFPELAESGIFDTLRLFDNNQERGVTAKLIFEQVDGDTQVLDDDAYDRFQKARPTGGAPPPPVEEVVEISAPEAPTTPEATLPDGEDSPQLPRIERTLDEVNAELAELNERMRELEASGADVTTPEEFDAHVQETIDLLAEIDEVQNERVPLVVREAMRQAVDNRDRDTLESLNTSIDSAEAESIRLKSRGQDASESEERYQNLIAQRDALLERRENNVGEIGPTTDRRPAGTVPSGVEGAPSRSARVERQGDTLRDVSGNVVATRIDGPSNANEIDADGSRLVELFEVNSDQAELFRGALQSSVDASEHGSSVTVHDLEYYQQDGVRMFLTQDGLGGVVLNGDEIVSGFMHPGASDRGQGAIISMVSSMVDRGGRRLDAYDTVLPDFYAEAGFKPVGRIKWDDAEAPEGWNYELYSRWNNGRPDIVFMAYDPERVGSDYNNTEGELLSDYGRGEVLQREVLATLDDSTVSEILEERNSLFAERRRLALEVNEELKSPDGLLLGAVPIGDRGAPDNLSLIYAPVGQTVEVTNDDGTKRRYKKVFTGLWKRVDDPTDLKRYRSHQIRTGFMEYVRPRDDDSVSPSIAPSPTTSAPVAVPYFFPPNTSKEELESLRESYQRQVGSSDNAVDSERSAATVRLIDRLLASRGGEILDNTPETPDNTPSRRMGAPLLPDNLPTLGKSTEPYTPGQVDVPGASDDPAVIANTFREVDLKNSYEMALITNSDMVRTNFPPAEDEIFGAEVNLPIDAVRDALQLMGIDTNQTVETIETIEQNRGEESTDPVTTADIEEYNFNQKELENLYGSYEQLRSARAYAVSSGQPDSSIANVDERMRALRERIRRLESQGLRITERPETVDVGQFRWDSSDPDIYRPGLVMEALRKKYPNATENSDGELVIGEAEYTVANGKRFKYEAVITKTDDELFYVYIRETNLGEEDPAKRFRSIRYGEMRHSARAVNIQAMKALKKIDNSAGGSNIHSWFNDRRRAREGRAAKFDVADAQGMPHHIRDMVLTRESIRKIQEAVDEDGITEEMVTTLYNYINNFGNNANVMLALYDTFGLDTPTLNRFVDATNQHIHERDGLNTFSLWESDNGTPLAEGDIVTYTGDPSQTGFDNNAGRRAIVKIRSLEHRSGGYTYTDYVQIKFIDDDDVPIPGIDYLVVSSHNLRLDRTFGNTDGSERRGPNAISTPLPVLTTRAGNRYAGQGRLGSISPYVTEYDRDTMASPTVEIDGVKYPVQASRQSLVGPDLTNIVARPGDMQTGDFIMQFDPTFSSRRLVEVVNVETLESGNVRLTLVEPINISSARVSQTEFDANSTLAIDAYRKDPNYAPESGLTMSHVGRLAETVRTTNIDALTPRSREVIRGILGSADARGIESGEFTLEDYNDAFLDMLDNQNNEPRGPVSLAEARRAVENASNRGLPDGDAFSSINSVRDASVSRGAELGVDTGVETLPSQIIPEGPPVLETLIPANLQQGPYGPNAGVVEGVDRARMVEILSMPKSVARTRAFNTIIRASVGDKVFGKRFTLRFLSSDITASSIKWNSRIVDPVTGSDVGRVERTYRLLADGTIDVHHDYVWLSRDEDTGTGFASEFYQVSDNFYRSIGVDINTMQTARDGSYAWAAANFTWASMAGISTIIARLYTKAKDYDSTSPETALQLRQMAVRLGAPEGYENVPENERAARLRDALRTLSMSTIQTSADYPDPVDIAMLLDPDDEQKRAEHAREQGLLPERERKKYKTLGREILQETGWNAIRYLNPELDPRPENRKNKKSLKDIRKEEAVEKAKKEFEEAEKAKKDREPTQEPPQGKKITSLNDVSNAQPGDVLRVTELGSGGIYIKQEDGSWDEIYFGSAASSFRSGYTDEDLDIRDTFTDEIREAQIFSTPEGKEYYSRYMAGTLTLENPTKETLEKALRDGDIATLDGLYRGNLLGNGQSKFGRNNFTLKVNSSGFESRGIDYDVYEVSGDILDENGQRVGPFRREIRMMPDGKLVVYHGILKIEDDRYKRTGFGKDFTKQSEALYRQMGVDTIRLHSAWDGSYFWAMQGYEWDLEHANGSKYEILGSVPGNLQLALEQAKGDGRDEDVAKLEDIIDRLAGLEIDDPNFPSPSELAVLKSQDPAMNDDGSGGNGKWMQDILKNTGWHGKKEFGGDEDPEGVSGDAGPDSDSGGDGGSDGGGGPSGDEDSPDEGSFVSYTRADLDAFYDDVDQGSSLSLPAQNAVEMYQVGGGGGDSRYEEINRGLRNGDEDVVNSSIVGELDEATSGGAELTRDVFLWRTIRLTIDDPRAAELSSLSPGDIIEDGGFVSTTADLDWAVDFSRRYNSSVLLQIEAPAGTTGVVPYQYTNQLRDEYEFILPRTTRFEVISGNPNTGAIRVRIV